MEFFPVFLRLQGCRALIVGGGEVAARKVGMLRRAGAAVTVVAPQMCPELERHAATGAVEHRSATFDAGQLADAALVIAATDDQDVNRAVALAARAARIPVNVVDAPALCTFISPAVIDRSPILIALSSGGAAPVLVRLLRERLETLIPAAYGRLARLAQAFRDVVKQRIGSLTARRRFWERVFRGVIPELVFSGQDARAQRELVRELNEPYAAPAQTGEVYLIGGGPGDPELLTLRALRLLQQADVIVHDHLVSDAVLDLARRDAQRIYVGKESGRHTLPQGEVSALLVALAQQGRRVARLKGGDPYVFGRGGEEAELLAENGILFQVVPGITAACGIAAASGVPLTHRDYAHSCVLVTGHLKDDSLNLDWDALARPRQTLAIYMGLKGLPILCRELIRHGLPAATPAMVVEKGTTAQQRVLTGTLESLPLTAPAARFAPPTLVIVGEVVRLRARLATDVDACVAARELNATIG
jgi:uroporphyrin-III C-methyltransferase/precorrin-2 dehydrogenase/sirohydrochlorin ferrochelatase